MVYHSDGLERLVQVDEVVRLNDDGTPSAGLNTWITKYAYDLNDQLTTILDSQNNLKSFAYDGLKRKTYLDDPNRGKMWFTYDGASNLRQSTDAKGQVIQYTHDGVNRILTEDYQDNGQSFSANRTNDVRYVYDAPAASVPFGDGTSGVASNTKGRLAYVVDISGEEHTSYDARGRESWVIKRIPDLLNGSLVSYGTRMAYDPMDRLSVLTYPDNDQVRHEYDDRGMLRRIYGDVIGNIVSNKDYHADGRMASCDYGNGVRTTHAYDSRLRLSDLFTRRLADPTNALLHFGYTFDRSINITRIDDLRSAGVAVAGDPRRNTQLYAYDDLYRLTRAQYSFNLPGQSLRDDGRLHYRYDRIGNMLSQTSSISQVEYGLPVTDLGMMESGGMLGRWNRTGRNPGDPPGPHALTSITNSTLATRHFPYDPNGNMQTIDGLNFTWDFKDRLVAVSNAEMSASYTYDYADRRITKHVVPFALSTNNQEVTTSYPNRYFEVRELDEPIKYVWDGGIRVARINQSVGAVGERVQKLRVFRGWNLLHLVVDASDAAQQIGITNTGAAQTLHLVEAAFRIDATNRMWLPVAYNDPLPAGSVFWLLVSSNATLTVLGGYTPSNEVMATAVGGFVSGSQLNPWSLPAATGATESVRYYDSSAGQWVAGHGGSLSGQSRLPSFLPAGAVVYARGTASSVSAPPGAAPRIQYYFQDHMGSSSIVGDTDGGVAEETANFAYGQPRNQYQPTRIRANYLFVQKERDSESGLSYHDARYLRSQVGRFISVDPITVIGEIPPDGVSSHLNVYGYAGGNPVAYSDPNGEAAQVIIGAFIGAAVDIAFNVLEEQATGNYKSNEEYLKSALVSAAFGAASGGISSLDKAGKLTKLATKLTKNKLNAKTVEKVKDIAVKHAGAALDFVESLADDYAKNGHLEDLDFNKAGYSAAAGLLGGEVGEIILGKAGKEAGVGITQAKIDQKVARSTLNKLSKSGPVESFRQGRKALRNYNDAVLNKQAAVLTDPLKATLSESSSTGANKAAEALKGDEK
jgi:RHS repeat-associated protein